MKKSITTIAITLGAILALAWGGTASAQTSSAQSAATARQSSWVSLRGTVVGAGLDTILVDNGDRIFTVEVDDLDVYAEGAQILQDDHVVVVGRVDHDLFEERRIEASSVFLPSLGTYLFASSLDEEDRREWAPGVSNEPSEVTVTGTVEAIHGDRITLSASGARISVDASEVASQLRRRGRARIEVGDRVRVTGEMGHDLLQGQELRAEILAKLTP